MTDFKDLLEYAAGDEPAITEDVLDADLNRGRRSVRRRRGLGVAAAAAGTAAAVAIAVLVAPGSPQAEPDVAGTATVTPAPTKGRPSRPVPSKLELPPEERLPPAPAPAAPVKLVPDGKERPGTDLVCDLKPEGWKAAVWPGDKANPTSELSFVHPTLHETGKYHRSTTQVVVRHAGIYDVGNGRMELEKYGQTWDELKFRQHRAGDRTAVVSGAASGPDDGSDGMRDFHMRMTATKVIQVHNSAAALGWDLRTALRFVGSCHYK